MSHSTIRRFLITSQSKISHTVWAFRLTHTASESIISFSTLRIPHETPFFAIFTLSI